LNHLNYYRNKHIILELLTKRYYYQAIFSQLNSVVKNYGTLPLSEYIGLTPALNHDLSVFKQIIPYLQNSEIYAYLKLNIDCIEREERLNQQNAEIYTPVKKKKGQKNLFLFEQLLSTSVSHVR